jgi:hypothetical protein
VVESAVVARERRDARSVESFILSQMWWEAGEILAGVIVKWAS